jgi:lipoprotein-anchoring transpeptidase ErfK/SrfK
VIAAAPTPPPAIQYVVAVTRAQQARVRPATPAPVAERIAARRPITGERTTLPLLGRATRGGARWLHVAMPGRPNRHSGWITAHGTRTRRASWRIDVDLSERRVEVRRDGRLQRRFTAVVGAAATPTPTGRFFVEETVRLGHHWPGGPFALALSARSEVLQEFDGGPGQIALHGRDMIGGTLGTAASHGCVRLAGGAIAWIAARVGPGVPVTVRR